MKISIEEKSGFCFGVTRVIGIAEEILDRGETLYCLGQIVHNENEVKRLIKKGIIFIEKEDLMHLHDVKVLIRAHGEPPETYRIAKENNIELIDGTCPIVSRLQKRIREDHITGGRERKIIIYGKKDHPEVVGLTGQTDNQALVVTNPDMLKELPLSSDISLYAQTTMDMEGFNRLRKTLEGAMKSSGLSTDNLRIHDTICRHISHRQPGIRNFAAGNDAVIFVAGKKSSNGKVLYEVCRSVNEKSYFVSDPVEVKREWLIHAESVGICGATSTPRWLLEEVAARVDQLTKN